MKEHSLIKISTLFLWKMSKRLKTDLHILVKYLLEEIKMKKLMDEF